MIFKREEVVGICFYRWSYYAGKKRLWAQSISVLNRQNVASSVEATTESGLALMELLTAEHPDIRVERGPINEGKEYDNWHKKLCGIR